MQSPMSLLDQLDKVDEAVRAKARQIVVEFAEIGVTTTGQLMIWVADGTKDTVLRSSGCWLLGRLRDGGAVHALKSVLEEGAPVVAQEAALSLGFLRDPAGLPALVDVLGSCQSQEQLREVAAYALGILGRMEAATPLIRATESDPSIGVRCHALESLGRLGGDNARTCLLENLNSPSPRIRYWAAYALGQSGSHTDTEALRRLLGDNEVGEYGQTVGQEAASAIEQIQILSAGD